MLLAASAVVTLAGPLQDRSDPGESIRIGFANEIPLAYPGENNAPLGFANAHAVGVLNAMVYEIIEPVVTDWGGLIPRLKAGQFDVITGGMYILSSHCENINFAEPMSILGHAFIVASSNPKGGENYADLVEKDATMVTGAGYKTVEAAKAEGVPDGNVIQVPGPTEILAAVRAGRADAGAVTYNTAFNLAEEAGGKIDVTTPTALPEKYLNWVGICFRPENSDFLDAFYAAQAEYLGSDAMLAAVAENGYTKDQLPGYIETAWVGENR